jgi:tetratricopeptide (TPR) repeat protein
MVCFLPGSLTEISRLVMLAPSLLMLAPTAASAQDETPPVAASQEPGAPPAAAHEISRVPALDQWMESQPAELRARIEEAFRLISQGEFQSALNGLASIRDGRPLPWEVQITIAQALKGLGRYGEAVQIYLNLEQTLGDEVDLLPGNLDLILGQVLVEARRFSEAIPVLERAWRRPGSLDNHGIYHQLALAYSALGERDRAFRAFALAFAANPQDSLARESLRGAEHLAPSGTPDSRRLPPHPDLDGARRLAAAPALNTVAEPDFAEAAAQYAAYATTLESHGWNAAASRHRETVLAAALGPAYRVCESDRHDLCQQELAAIMARPNYEAWPPFVHDQAARFEIAADVGQQHFLHAAAAFERLSAIPDVSRAEIAAVADWIEGKAFDAVSFDPLSGSPRTSDPDDFIGQEWARSVIGGEPTPPLSSGSGRTGGLNEAMGHAYAEVSASEDHAEMTTAIFMAELYPQVEPALIALVRARIEARNFELPVKMSVDNLVSHFLDHPISGTPETLRSLLDQEIAREVDPAVTPVTLEVYFAGKLIESVVERMQARPHHPPALPRATTPR